MVTTNLTLAKHTDGRPLAEEDIRVGLEVVYPSQTGGVLNFRCTSCNESGAQFKSTHPDWPMKFGMKFNQPDFTVDDFKALSEALTAFDSINTTVTDEQRQLVNRARELGYAAQASHTQAHWTERGIARAAALRADSKGKTPSPTPNR